MRKLILQFFVIVILLSLVSCRTGKQTQKNMYEYEEIPIHKVLPNESPLAETSNEEEDNFFGIIESGENFRILQLSESKMDLRFEIIDNSGETIWNWDCWGRGGFDFVGDNLLRYRTGAGTYAWWEIYFCPRKGILSEEFSNPFFLKDRLVALFGFDENSGRTVVIRDIFDKEIFYLEYYINDFVDNLHFTASGSITYLGNDEIEISDLFFGDDFSEANLILSIVSLQESQS
ncbi:MAG: hypothetical protein FWD90_06970 [Defluviitaleaceae bacterium]|nr:hypothetical protein [Defluviitaleaceae bacterium]